MTLNKDPNTSPFNAYCENLQSIGFDPVPLSPGKKYPTDKGWQTNEYVPDEKWNHHGVGHRCHTIGALDADILDQELSHAFLSQCKKDPGIDVIRVGLPPKWASMVRNEYGQKRVSKTFIDPNWKPPKGLFESKKQPTHKIEFLGAGQQIVLLHQHPDTGLPYTWGADGSKRFEDMNLPAVDAVVADRIMARFEEMCLDRGFKELAGRSTGSEGNTHFDKEREAAWLERYGGVKEFHDPIAEVLEKHGLVRQYKGMGKYELRCPWGDDHSSGDPNGAAYWAPIGELMLSRFTCLHVTCQAKKRNYGDLLGWIQEMEGWI